MATDPQSPAGPTGNPNRQRPAPTIDLEATEVASEPVAATASENEARSKMTDEVQPPKQAASAGAATASKLPRARAGFGSILSAGILGALFAVALGIAAAVVGKDQYFGEDTRVDALASKVAGIELQVQELAARPAAPAATSSEPTPAPTSSEPAPAGADPKAVEELAARVAQLEATVGAAATTTAPRPADGPDPALTGRLSALDDALKGLDGAVKALDEKMAAVAQRADANAAAITDLQRAAAQPPAPVVDNSGDVEALGTSLKGLDTALKALDQKLADLGGRTDANAAAIADLKQAVAKPAVTRADVDALTTRLTTIEQSLKTFEADVGKRLSAEVADRATRVALTAAALNTAVEASAPYTAQLTALKALGVDAKPLVPLDRFAASGVPSAAVLGQELVALMPTLVQAAGATAPQPGGSFLDRLHANAEKLVRLRRTDEVVGDDLTSILTRIELRAAQADIPGALAELARLPDAARAPAQAWILKAQARDAALTTSRKLAADAVAVLGKTP